MRLFIAIPISESIRQAFKETVQTLQHSQKATDKIKWVAPENIHLTIKFLGEVDSHQLENLIQSLKQSIQNQKSFTLQIRGLGAFPNLNRARVLWAGISGEEATLMSLARYVEVFTLQAGFVKADKPFSAHLTLARLNAKPSQEFCQAVQKIQETNFGLLEVHQIVLIQSQLKPWGPLYSYVEAFNF